MSIHPYLESLYRLEQAVLTVSLGSVTMGDDQPYLAMGPKDLLESCDVLLKLDDGSELPAHSQILARCMSVFSGMVATGGPLSRASAENVTSVPFSECSLEDASCFLSAIYASRPPEYIQKSALSIARLSHKYGGEDFLKMCDDFLGERAGINIEPPEKTPAYLQDQKHDSFMDIMRSASLFGMPKLLACCEYYVALSCVDTSHAELRTLCASEQLLARSWARIAESFVTAIQRVTAPAIRPHCDLQPCACECCKLYPNNHGGASCKCSGPVVTKIAVGRMVPSPKEFLKMAAAAEKPK